ncbi:hypothetical protein LSTR_LSTR001006 [Laodelphax striatellus]|uniref:Uncharacterized protein n=1 Tax=Laodelphax striatellus TaxID=195883 RepID=A0A482X0W6_LAOST|nr:hypothetical protein LSTR_LSTR001006 [Laodelphax striatellus]
MWRRVPGRLAGPRAIFDNNSSKSEVPSKLGSVSKKRLVSARALSKRTCLVTCEGGWRSLPPPRFNAIANPLAPPGATGICVRKMSINCEIDISYGLPECSPLPLPESVVSREILPSKDQSSLFFFAISYCI